MGGGKVKWGSFSVVLCLMLSHFLSLVLPVNHLDREINEIVVSLSFLTSHLASLVFILFL